MGMPITIEAVDEVASTDLFDEVFSYFRRIDERFSTFKETSEITAINNQQVAEADWSAEMKEVMALAEQTRQQLASMKQAALKNGRPMAAENIAQLILK